MKFFRLKYLLVILLILVFFARFHMALTRAFDPDEFAHMHWAWLVRSGQLPYRDFFFYNTPLFQFLLAPVFSLPEGAGVVIVIRLLQFLSLAALSFLVCLIAQKTGLSRSGALLAALVFAVFPMNVDKLVDVRPDVLMLALYFLSVWLVVGKPLNPRRAFLVGLFITASALVMPKIVFALPALIYLYFLGKPKPAVRFVPYVIAGGALLTFLVFLPVIFTGSLPAMITSIFSDSVVVNAGKTPFSPWKALSPWPLVYVAGGGPSLPWYVNSGIWTAGIIGFIFYFLKNPRYGIFFLLYTVTGLIFLFAFPAPYLQYFLPLSIVASLSTAYLFIDLAPKALRFVFGVHYRLPRLALLTLAFTLLFWGFTIQYRLRVSAGWNNEEQLTVLNDIPKVIKPDERVYDMVGSYVFRPDGYVFCCHPYAEFIDQLGRPFPTLKQSIISTQTKFVILDRTGMAFWQPKPDDLLFLERHFVPSPYRKIYVAGQQFNCSGGRCELLDVHGRGTGKITDQTEIVIPETYEIVTVPPNNEISVDERPITGAVTLAPGFHRFFVSPTVTKIIFRIKR